METVKVYWESEDRFNTIHKKLTALVGTNVANKKGGEFTIFRVSEICETEFVDYLRSMVKFMEGDESKSTSKGDFDFKDGIVHNQWGFTVEYGYVDKQGNSCSMPYNFTIPRTDNYEKDLEDCGYMRDDNHPFIFYK